jgi:hypothetical protein
MRAQHLALGTAICLLAHLAGLAYAVETVPVVPEAAFPNARQPQVAVAPSGKVFVVYGAGDTIYCAVSPDGGKSYDAPIRVGQAGNLALGMRRGPRVAATEKAVVVTAICGPIGKGRDGDVLAWRSADDGKSWQGPVAVNRVSGSAREGLHHLAAGPDGSVYCVWLDLRANKMQVYGARASDGGATWQAEKLIYASPDGSVCECCQPSVAYDPRGGVHVLWRNQLAGARDMYLASSVDGGRSFGPARKLGQGTWPLEACPMDGGGLAVNADGGVETVWRREKEVFRCTAGRAEVSLGRGEQGWAASGTSGVYLVWIVGRPGTLQALLPGSDQPVRLADRAWDPVVAGPVNGRGPIVAAWEEGRSGSIRIRAAVLAPVR